MKSILKPCGAALAALATLCGGFGIAPAVAHETETCGGYDHPRAVYTMSNDATANSVLVYRRACNGSLTLQGTFPTGGRGSGAGLGNQGGVVLSGDHRFLLAVDAGSNDVTVFAVKERGLTPFAQAPSGGNKPVSVTIDDDLVYVLNAGSDNISGFRLGKGKLQPMAGSTRPLSATGTGPAEIKFSPDGRSLVVTEKATNKITIYSVGPNGTPGQTPTIVDSAGQTPFGFDFARWRTLIVSEAAGGAPNASTVSSYQLSRTGALSLVDGSVPTNQTAACWIAVTLDGRYAYSTNTHSGSISGFSVAPGGGLNPLSQDGRTGVLANNGAPIDLAITEDDRYLYALDSQNHAISGFAIGAGGSLTLLGSMPGLPMSANGLAAD